MYVCVCICVYVSNVCVCVCMRFVFLSSSFFNSPFIYLLLYLTLSLSLSLSLLFMPTEVERTTQFASITTQVVCRQLRAPHTIRTQFQSTPFPPPLPKYAPFSHKISKYIPTGVHSQHTLTNTHTYHV